MRVELQQVTKRFGGTLALDEVSLDIPAGSVVAVLGENGAGKSTLLRLLGAVCVADSGRICLDGESFDRENLALRRRLMIIPEVPFLFFDASVAKNVAMHARFYGRSLEGRTESLAALMEDMGIGALGLRTAGRLSRGQIWKTALACVAAVEPELWLVDEPFASGMDAVGMAAFRRQARARAEAGGTVVYTTQMVELAADFADRVCVLREGRIALWDTSAMVRTLLASPAGAEGVLRGTLSQP